MTLTVIEETLLTYVTTLAFYLHLRSMPRYCANPRSLQAHPILSRLLSLKQALASMEKLDFAPSSDQENDTHSDEYDLATDMESLLSHYDSGLPMNEDDFQALLQAAKDMEARESGIHPEDSKNSMPNGYDSTKSEKAKKRKKKRQREGDEKPEFVFDLEEPDFVVTSKKIGRTSELTKSSRDLQTFGEHTSLDAVDSADKAARKKSLKFHTSKIENTAAKRAKAVVGGDDDIPYREREKERQLRIERESAKRVASLGQGGDDLEPTEPTKVGTKRPRDDDDDLGSDGYYDLVKRQKQEKSDRKKAEYIADKALEKRVYLLKHASNNLYLTTRATREGDGDELSGNQRSLTRAILKNKGLTPHRSKSVRNPRVKKRMKFDEAKKKVKSQKAVFSGGLAATGGQYVGETSGITSRVVKSVKLG